jgi:hypothetical protein
MYRSTKAAHMGVKDSTGDRRIFGKGVGEKLRASARGKNPERRASGEKGMYARCFLRKD